MKPIHIENGVIIYYGNLVGRVTEGCALVDPMFQGEELKSYLEKQKNIQEVRWKDGVFERLMSSVKENHDTQMLKNCRVWQLKPDVDVRMKFISYTELLHDFGLPNPDNYQVVFDGEVNTNNLEELYIKFNHDHPFGYSGHSLSMSDVLELYDEASSNFHYVDRFGFQQVDFSPPSQQMGQTMQF